MQNYYAAKIGLRSGVAARRGGGMSLLSSETMTTTGRQKINKKWIKQDGDADTILGPKMLYLIPTFNSWQAGFYSWFSMPIYWKNNRQVAETTE